MIQRDAMRQAHRLRIGHNYNMKTALKMAWERTKFNNLVREFAEKSQIPYNQAYRIVYSKIGNIEKFKDIIGGNMLDIIQSLRKVDLATEIISNMIKDREK